MGSDLSFCHGYYAQKERSDPFTLLRDIWGNLCKEAPVLAEYEKVVQKFTKTQGYHNEQLQRALQTIEVRITNDSRLLNQLQRDLPNVATKILSQALAQKDRARSY